MSNQPPHPPPSNGGEFLLSLLHNSQTPPSQQQPSRQPSHHSLTADPAVAAVGPALQLPSLPPQQLPHHHQQQQLWNDLAPPLQPTWPQRLSPPGGFYGNSVSIPGNQFAGLNYGVGVLEDGVGVHHQQQQQGEGERLMFGSIPSGIGRFEASGVGGFNGVGRDRQLLDRLSLNGGLNLAGYQGFEPGRMGTGWENQYGSLNMRTPSLMGNRTSGDRGFGRNVDKEKERGNGLSYGSSMANVQNEGVRRMWSEDGKKVGEVGLSGQLDHPGPSAGSNLRSVLSSDMEDGLMKLRVEVGGNGDRKYDRREEDNEDIDDLGEEMVDSLLLEDESGSQNKKKPHKEFRSDSRGQHMLSQRVRSLKRQMRCRRDIERLNIPFIEIYKSLIPVEEEKAKQKQLLMSLEKIILKEWPHARLYVYGSCASSFGVCKSDIDVCLAFGDMDINKSEVLLKLAEMLESNNLQNVQALTRARVPIVKLMDPVTGLSCDICINNVLAVVNTKLLRDYAQIDVRLHQLAFIVKHWAKCRGVNETYQGTLSSYAYVLMCIHFLQQRKPAILPCLQRMETTYSVNVDDIQCAFFDKVERLRTFGSSNKESVAQLVWGFFNYWAFGHDYANSVVSIRTGSIICKRDKDWTRRVGNDRHLICIEDPFETSHDLGRVVDRRSIRVLREEFERAADIMQYDPQPFVTLFEPYVTK